MRKSDKVDRLTPARVESWIANNIVPHALDVEVAHAALDDIWEDILTDIANGTCDEPAECARLALEALSLLPVRWYA